MVYPLCRVANLGHNRPAREAAALRPSWRPAPKLALPPPPSMLTPPNRPHALLGGVHNSTSSASAPRRKGGYILPGGPPNILMVLSDDHGFTDIGPDIDSNVVTPVLTALRKNGMHFANGYATAAQCVPSRAGLLSGRNQSTYLTLTLPLTLALALTLTLTLTRNQNTFGLWKNEADAGFGASTLPPRPHVTTIAEHLKGLGGYVTGITLTLTLTPTLNLTLALTLIPTPTPTPNPNQVCHGHGGQVAPRRRQKPDRERRRSRV